MEVTLNGQTLAVLPQHGNLSLLEWIREQAHVKSAKLACGEGGCGACACLVRDVDVNGETPSIRSVNSCLTPVYAVNGCNVLTAEGLPKNSQGQNPVAERLAGFHASQCGFCTPGMAVACHSALAKAAAAGKPAPSAADMRNALDGNLCRCTGYRPIIAACKSFASDVDMEDLGTNMFTTCGKPLPAPVVLEAACAVAEPPSVTPPTAEYALAAGQKLLVPHSLEQLVQVVCDHAGGSMRLVAGNTGPGVYKDWPTQDVLVHLMHVCELRQLHEGPEPRMMTLAVAPSRAVHVGAAVTLAAVIDKLLGWVAAADKATDLQHPGVEVRAAASVWHGLASHLGRVAGSHVRGSATLVGNLVLARRRGLPSDVATLMMAAGGEVEVVEASQGPSAQPVRVLLSLDDFLHKRDVGMTPDLDSNTLLVTAVMLPTPSGGSQFWSNRVAARWANAASVINAAALRPGAGSGMTPTFVLGMDLSNTPGQHQWRVQHCRQVEAELAALAATPPSLSALALPVLAALAQDLRGLFGLTAEAAAADDHAAFLRSTAEGLLLQALAALFCTEADEEAAAHGTGQNGHAAASTNGSTMHTAGLAPAGDVDGRACPLPAKLEAPAVAGGRQDLPAPDPAYAPLTQAMPKESALLQALGTARYTDDVPVLPGALYAAWVTSPVAKGTVRNVDATAALQVPGAVRFIGPQDIPGKDPSAPIDEPVFGTEIMYHGQGVGLMLAETQQAALRAARLVVVEVDAPATPAVLTIKEALAQGAMYDLTKKVPTMGPGKTLQGSIAKGADDVADKVAAAPLRLLQQRLHVPSQAHMYMEPQTAVAELDEDGCVCVHSSTQMTERGQILVAALLGVPHNKVEVRCRRVGGGFGGKATNPSRFAGAAAVAAVATGRQVRLATNRNVDLAMIGGRCQVEVTYDVGYDEEGHLLALDMQHVLLGGGYCNLAWMDAMMMCSVSDNVYHVPSMRAEYALTHCNLPARTAVRAPGDFAGVFVMESVVERVAAALGIDPLLVRERNMRQPTPGAEVLTSSLGKPLGPPEQYSLPRMWQELKAKVDWDARVAAVQHFNTHNQWRKRGLSITPCMYPLMVGKRNAIVHVYADGSVRVAHPGIEIGQGLGIKVLQTAAYELSQALPESQRPLPMELLRAADPSTYTLPHNSLTAGSTTSDAACAAVRSACGELVSRLKPFGAQLGDTYTWQQLIAKTFFIPGFRGMVDLTAAAETEPSQTHSFTSYGAGVAEVEVDVLTGDRQVLSVDILFDCGRSLNPAVDLGQIEGAFVFGMGMLLSEHMEADPTTGACTTNSTWSYKVPGAMCVPQQLNVAMLKDSPLSVKGPLSAKAVGEPPLLLSCAVLFALESAVRAAAQQVYGDKQTTLRLQAPATPQAVKKACGTAPLSQVLTRLAGNKTGAEADRHVQVQVGSD